MPLPPQQLVPDHAVLSIKTAVSWANFPFLSFSLSCTTASTLSSPARAVADLFADVLPAILRPPHLVHRTHHAALGLTMHSPHLTAHSSHEFVFNRTPAAAKVAAGANSGHPEPNHHHQ